MADEWISKTRPGAFQDPSFGTNGDGWYAVIQFTMLFCTLTNEVAVLIPVHALEVGHSVGGGLNAFTAIGLVGYGVWTVCFMSLRRWTIAISPVMAWLMLVAGVGVLGISLLPHAHVLPGDKAPVSLVAQIFASLSIGLAAFALGRMRSPRFRAYNKAALGQ